MRNHLKRFLFVSAAAAAAWAFQPAPAQAWFFSWGGNHGYNRVEAGGSTYYYNGGEYYTGGPGNYVAADAPEGAVIYHAPPASRRVVVEGRPYYVSHGVYYVREGRGWRVAHGRNWRHDDHDHDRDQGGRDHDHHWDNH